MALEIINSILESEKQAAEIRQGCSQNIKQQIKEAEIAGGKLVSDTEAETRIRSEEILRKAEKEIENLVLSQKNETAGEREKILKSANSNLEKAVKFIIGELAQL